ncbi:MAG: OprO/OprP family phosphate-selective porin [Xanthomonadales bacterium]|nr:OprO/OprP family phosphate-selective porin [Xanthomonadales bacterium]
MLVALPAAGIELGQAAGAQWQFEGLFQGDHTAFAGDSEQLDDDSELRRAELVLKGARGRWDWVAGYDLASRNDKWLDLNLRLRLGTADQGPGNGQLRVGQFKHFNSLEELTSSRHNDFIAKAMATSTFAIGRRLGTGIAWSSGPWWLGGSWFGRELASNGGRGSGYSLRAAWAPMRADGRIVHLAVSGMDRDSDGDSARLRARTGFEPASVPRLVDTGTVLDADRIRSLGLEAAWVAGPVKLQGEYLDSTIRRVHTGEVSGLDPAIGTGGDFHADGWYLSGLWNLGGGSWAYRDGVVSTRPREDASGLWQLAARIEGLDLDDGNIDGGHARVLTVGSNWYWRSHVRVSLNHVRADLRRPDRIQQSPSAWVARLQLHW